MIHAGFELFDMRVEKCFQLRARVVDRNDPSKGFQFTYTEHFTKDIYLRLVSILKEFQKKWQIENSVQGHLSYLIGCKAAEAKEKGKIDDQDYLDLLTLKWEQSYAAALGYEKLMLRTGKLLRNVKKTRNRLNSICHVVCNIYNNNDELKNKPLKEVAEDFSKMLSKYRILDNGRMIATGIAKDKSENGACAGKVVIGDSQ